MIQLWGSFPNRKERWGRSTIRCVKEGQRELKPERLDAHVRDVCERKRDWAYTREKKKKIEVDPSSEWLAQRIISCCSKWPGDTEPPDTGPHFNLPQEGRGLRVGWVACVCVCVCVWTLEGTDLLAHWVHREVTPCRKEWQPLSNYCCALWLLSSKGLNAPVNEFVKFERVSDVCVCACVAMSALTVCVIAPCCSLLKALEST